MDRDLARQACVVAAVAAGIASGATGDYGSSSEAGTVLVAPPDWSFTIWAPIYAGAIGYAAHQARPSRRRDPLLRATGWPAATAYLTSGLWVRTDHRPRLEIAVIAATTTAAAIAHTRTAPSAAGKDTTTGPARGRAPGSAHETRADAWLVRAPLGLFTGWISLAAVVATAQALVEAGVGDALGLRGETASSIMLLAAGGIGAAATTAVPSSPAYPAALAWGLLSVTTERLPRRPRVGAAAGVAALAVMRAAARARRTA